MAEPTRLRPADTLGEAIAAIVTRPARSALTAVGTLLAVASFVTVLGLTSTAAGQVTAAFNQRLPTLVRVTVAPVRSRDQLSGGDPFPGNVSRRLDALHGVLAASPGFLAAAGARVSQGRLFGGWDVAHAKPVCVLGAAAAAALGISRLDQQPAVIINGLPCTVIGLISQVRGQRWILRSVLMPTTAASGDWASPADLADAQPGVLIETRPGAARLIARQAPLILSERDPAQLLASVRPGPSLLRGQVSAVLAGLFALLAWSCLLIGAAGITSSTLVAVRERTAEIGLRRALGARGRHIAVQFLTESALLGLLGGLAGTSLGLGAVACIALVRGWMPVIAPQTVWPAPLLGAAVGLLAGAYPSWRASRVEPARALSEHPAV